jgi:hypothetical protein
MGGKVHQYEANKLDTQEEEKKVGESQRRHFRIIFKLKFQLNFHFYQKLEKISSKSLITFPSQVRLLLLLMIFLS